MPIHACPFQAGGQQSREWKATEISAGLKALVKKFKVSVIVLAQPNRNPEMRMENSTVVPRTSDLCESGSIEQDSHMSAKTVMKKAGVNICGAL